MYRIRSHFGSRSFASTVQGIARTHIRYWTIIFDMGDTGIPRYILEVAQSFFTRLRGGINANDNVDHLRWLFKTIVGMPKASSAFVEVCDEYGEWCDLPWGHGSAVEFVTRENLGPPYDSRFLTVGRLATYIKARRSVTRRRQASILVKRCSPDWKRW